MSSDAAYAAFLDKANEDTTTTTTTNNDSGFLASKTLDVDEQQIPASLRSVDAFYSSETDEPFEPVVLACDHWPSEGITSSTPYFYSYSLLSVAVLLTTRTNSGTEEFSRLVHGASSTQVSVLSATQFDAQGQYAGVVKAVQAAGHGGKDVRVYRVQHGATRVEYWLLALGQETLVGLKARAVES
ncbi:uncharacterized protein GIQ15_02031 [Arthroderma uncinatum]|uniref:uncharacterized protein n=1 Tax=Arthroderma uncinatum TaxID=74035 RepID=UPI00144A7389|nr:uncharacterized protein GIQ15_02031 [Arthroderma uncinatum]KAF3482707.1 hypothetical protein GIQ15_02031 [Arthroderma uncinatum]